MEVLVERAVGRSRKSFRRRGSFGGTIVLGVLVLLLAWGGANQVSGLQKNVLEAGAQPAPATEQQPAAVEGHGAAPVTAVPHGAGTTPAAPPISAPQPHAVPVGHEPPTGHAAPAGHGVPVPGAGDAGGHGEGHHGPPLPEISPIAGVTFVETMIQLLEHELHGRVLGWRPNDIIVGKFTDNINNYQLGVLEAIRFTTGRLKDSLTRMGDADTYDQDLEKALHLLMNSATLFWFPSAEGSYDEALDHLRAFVEKLKTGKRSFYYRKDNLVALIATYRDLLGNVNKSLVPEDVGYFNADDYFYYAKGVAHVYYEILRVVRVAFQTQLASTLYGIDIMDTILHELSVAENMEPWLILDCSFNSFFAHHRANLNAPLSEVSHLMVVMSQL